MNRGPGSSAYIEADMNSGPPRPFISVKFSPVGRTYSFLLPELALDDGGIATTSDPVPPLSPGGFRSAGGSPCYP